jgi:hypothetical protein
MNDPPYAMEDSEFPKPYILNIPGKINPTWVVKTPRGISYFEDGDSAHDFWVLTKFSYHNNKNKPHGNQSQSR